MNDCGMPIRKYEFEKIEQKGFNTDITNKKHSNEINVSNKNKKNK